MVISEQQLTKLTAMLVAVEKYALSCGVDDIYSFNEARTTLMRGILQLDKGPQIRGDDAYDSQGCACELKSLRLEKKDLVFDMPGITVSVLAHYRKRKFRFGTFSGIIPYRIYGIDDPSVFEEPYFKKWEAFLNGANRKNKVYDSFSNPFPKITYEFVKKHGELLYKAKA